jgi:hypothetical protein
MKLTFIAHFVPVHVVEIESAACSLFHQLIRVVRTEGCVAAKQDVGDDTAHPPSPISMFVSTWKKPWRWRLTRCSTYQRVCCALYRTGLRAQRIPCYRRRLSTYDDPHRGVERYRMSIVSTYDCLGRKVTGNRREGLLTLRNRQ